MQKFPTPNPITTTLNIPAGRIQIIAADRTDTTVEIRPANPNKNRDIKTAQQTTANYHDGTLHIQTPTPKNQLLGPTGAVEVTIQLPTGSHIQSTTTSTELRAAGHLGHITYDTYHHIKIDEADQAQLTAMDGNIEIGRLNGPAQITTTRGNITITQALRGNLTLTTQAGDVSVGAAHGVSATLDAGTTLGRIHNTLTNTEGPNAPLDIHATTTQGNIEARSL